MPNYTMSIFRLPLGVCHEIENMFNSFWWKNTGNVGKGISWMRWERPCKPKSIGGLGFQKLHEFNLALLSKHGWKFLSDPMSLVSQVYGARYFPYSSFLNSKLGANPSYTWRSIHATKDLIWKHSRFRVGDGTNILVTKDPWLLINESGMISSVLGESHNETIVHQLMILGEIQWDKNLITDVFNPRDREIILGIPLSVRNIKDSWH